MAQAVDRRKTEKKEELVEKLVHINRVAKTVKGGRNMSCLLYTSDAADD